MSSLAFSAKLTNYVYCRAVRRGFALPRMRKVLYNFLTELADFSRRYKQYASNVVVQVVSVAVVPVVHLAVVVVVVIVPPQL